MLNPNQTLAVEHFQGPALVLAGAGAGKTRVLTHRIAHLIQNHGIAPSRLLVVTFTNKAAKEMRERLTNLLGEPYVRRLWVGTFHAICSRILREEIEALGGYNRRFAIYDPDDQEKLMKQTLERLDLDLKQYKPRAQLKRISELKNKGLRPADFRNQAFDFSDRTLARIYDTYQEALGLNNAVDFDDLMLLTLQLLNTQPALRERYQQHFQFILVDEYQDTNPVQFELLQVLAQKSHNLFVVGDVDQSIYSFRNADFQIILRFQEDFKNARVIKLEENYRSRRPILAAANSLINHNRERFDKILIGTRGDGPPIHYHEAASEYAEADYIVRQIQKLVLDQGHSYGDCCVLYRTNAQSRLFEERLVRLGIPHQLIGAFRFYERKEIKDLMAYLSVLHNPLNSLALRRVINTPKRGIGPKTLQTLDRAAEKDGLSLWDALQSPNILSQASPKNRATLTELMQWLGTLTTAEHPVSLLIERIYRESGYQADIRSDDERGEDREAYVESFIQAAREYESGSDTPTLDGFLEHIALVSDIDALKDEGRLVTLMTVHGAKGLEFPFVFVSGLEEGVFPHQRAINEEEEGLDGPIEEERRLMYVAMTRAQEQLFLSHARMRTTHGQSHVQYPSRFLEEIAAHLPKQKASPPAPKKKSYAELWDEVDPAPKTTRRSKLKLQEGDDVFHAEWGYGCVLQVTEQGSRQTAVVAFQGKIGKRILDTAVAPLEKVYH
jgi:DNA helicase-2/ATP-dependent DNA helicase PcrA